MKRTAMIAATCILGLVLSACGDNNPPKPAVSTPTTPAGQTTPDKTTTDQNQTH